MASRGASVSSCLGPMLALTCGRALGSDTKVGETPMLADADVTFYRENGYLVVDDVLGADEIDRLRATTDALIRQSGDVTAHNEVYDLEDDHKPDQPRVRRIKTPHKWHKTYHAMVTHPLVLEVMEALIGPGVRFDNSKLNVKAAAGGAAVEWHQDWAFYPHTNDDLCAVGFMLDDVTLENGPLMVVPGSHRGPIYDHHADGRFCGAITDAAADPLYAQAVPLTGRAGAISIHHVRIVHGSTPNLSHGPRRLLLHQYRAADAWPIHETLDPDYFKSLLLTGAPSVEPRLEPVPVRMPFPPAIHQGSIYENQRATGRPHLLS